MASSKLPPLKPCPFCGGEAVNKSALMGYTGKLRFWIECAKCYARSEKMRTRRGADNRWNKREGGDGE